MLFQPVDCRAPNSEGLDKALLVKTDLEDKLLAEEARMWVLTTLSWLKGMTTRQGGSEAPAEDCLDEALNRRRTLLIGRGSY